MHLEWNVPAGSPHRTSKVGRYRRTNSATVSTSASVPVATHPWVQSKAVAG